MTEWYGISWGSNTDYKLLKFESYDEASEWLNEEYGDFRLRQISDDVDEINVIFNIESDEDDYIEAYMYWGK